jgi:mannose-6-phosphate isomerase-like protein (cupin superfamily)
MAPEKNHTAAPNARHVPLAAARALKPPAGALSAPVFEHGTLLLKLYAPKGKDEQVPHTRDELYVVAQGSGVFRNGGERHAFASGDALFVPAGVPHGFESFSDDFSVWVMFYGPEGGEKP